MRIVFIEIVTHYNTACGAIILKSHVLSGKGHIYNLMPCDKCQDVLATPFIEDAGRVVIEDTRNLINI
jgi:hypothetical protein